MASCTGKDIETFHGSREIYFEKFYMNAISPGSQQADTTSVSFFFYPEGTTEINVPLTILLSGQKLSSDIPFALRVIDEETTALPSEYELNDSYIFHSRPVIDGMMDFRDTIQVKVKYSERLSEEKKQLTLVVELVPNKEVDLGQFERRRAVIVWSNIADKPDWWNYEIENSLLGEYSYEKYKLFLEVVPNAIQLNEELIKENPAEVRSMVQQFKKWLIIHQDDPEKGEKYREILNSLK